MMSCYLLFLIILGWRLLTTKAYEVCNPLEPEQFVCENTNSAIAYCCNYFNLDYHSCCYSDYVWSLWYFWFGIVAGLVCIIVLLGGLYSCYKTNRHTRISATTNQNVPLSEIDQSVQIRLEDAPPSYDHVVIQQTIPIQSAAPEIQTQSYSFPQPPFPNPATHTYQNEKLQDYSVM